MTPLVSVVVPNRDYARFLPGFFAALAAQSLGLGEVEVIFVDDASSDDSLTLARRLGEGLGAAQFTAVASPPLGHPALTRNLGMSWACAPLAACLDPDDLPGPDFLAACLDTLKAGADVAYCDVEERTVDGSRLVALPDFDADILRTQNIPTAMAAMFRRRVFEEGGGFRANTAYEDWDFWVRAAAQGFTFVRVARPLYVYNRHPGSFTCQAVLRDGPAKAAIVANTPDFFDPEVRRWAKGLREGKPWAQPLPRGIIPRPQDVRRLRDLHREVQAVRRASGGRGVD